MAPLEYLSSQAQTELTRSHGDTSEQKRSETMPDGIRSFIPVTIFAIIAVFLASPLTAQDTSKPDDPDAHPPVTQDDVKIVRRAQQILDSPTKWNRADNRECPAGAKTFSLYCALEKATYEATGKFEHRGAAMQQARFVIDEIAPNSKNYHHRLMDYNNDPTTTFADVQTFFRKLEDRVSARLKEQSQSGNK
jgi:hypothetical protein